MWWECNHLVANEVFPTGSIYGTNEEWLKTCSIRSLTVESEPEDIYAFWRKFISLYAGYKLTYEKDRFPAAAGIARTLDELTNDNFVAGFWEGDLIRSLILTPRGRIEDVPTKQRASSWSWASLRACCITEHIGSEAQAVSGVSLSVLSDLAGFKSDLDSNSLEVSDVRGLKITAPLRKLPVDLKVGCGTELWRWDLAVPIEDAILESNDSLASEIPENEAWRLCGPTHVLILAKEYGHPYGNDESKEARDTSPLAWALLIQQVPEVEDGSTFRKLGNAAFHFRTEESLKEYFGLREDDEEYVPGPVFVERGFQEIVLI